MRYAVLTFGCRVNQADSFALERQLRAAGGRAAPAEAAELVVVNSCSVTASADQGTRQAIRRVARLNPDARIVATGCYATRDAAAVAALPGVVGRRPRTATRRPWPNGWWGSRDPSPPAARPPPSASEAATARAERPLPPGAAGRTTYTLRVQTGCDECCSYCIIPSTRGRGRSVPLASVLDELDRAVAAGYRELALTGVHLGSYGRRPDAARVPAGNCCTPSIAIRRPCSSG